MALITRASALAATTLVLLAGCGGDSGGSDEDAIAEAAKTGFTTKDLKVKCEEIISESFLREVYGDVAQCRKAEKPDADDEPATDVKSENIQVDSDRATAKVTLQGGSASGATGTLDLRKEDGDWKVNDLGADLLRSNLEREIQNDDDPQFDDPAIKSCAVETFSKLGDEELQKVAYAAIGERAGADEQLGKLLIPCFTKSQGGGDVSFLRQKFEEGIEESAKRDGASQQVIDCVKRELRESISDDEIAELAQNGGKASSQLTQRAAEAIRSCQTEQG